MTDTSMPPPSQMVIAPTPGQPTPAVGSVMMGLIVRSATSTAITLDCASTPAELATVKAWAAEELPPAGLPPPIQQPPWPPK